MTTLAAWSATRPTNMRSSAPRWSRAGALTFPEELTMKLTELATFEVAHEKLSWPWIAFDANGRHIAFVEPTASGQQVASRILDGDRIASGPSFSLPADLRLPTAPPTDAPVRDATAG